MTKKYRLLKDLPFAKTGEVFTLESSVYDAYNCESAKTVIFRARYVENNPDWFAPIESAPKWAPAPGEIIEVRDNENDKWFVDRFEKMASGTEYIYECRRNRYKHARPLPSPVREKVGMFVRLEIDGGIYGISKSSEKYTLAIEITDTLARQLLGELYPLQPGKIEEV